MVMFYYLTIVLVSLRLAFKKQMHIPLVVISKTMWLKLCEATPVKMTLDMFVTPFLPEGSRISRPDYYLVMIKLFLELPPNPCIKVTIKR